MTQQIIAGATTINPDLVLSYEIASESTNILHRIIGRTDHDVSLGNDLPRSGSLELFFLTRAAAHSARTALATASVFTYTDTDLTQTNMSFVRDGQMRLRLDGDTRTRWVLELGFQEVIA